MKIQWKPLLLCLAIPLAVGGASALITRNGMTAFEQMVKPPLSPPAWLFPVAWTILYLLMGLASYLIVTSGHPARSKTALAVYGVQLAFNFFWSIIFFSLQAYWVAFGWLIALWFFICLNTILFYRLRKWAGYLLLPYLGWVAFAGYLNAAIALLN